MWAPVEGRNVGMGHGPRTVDDGEWTVDDGGRTMDRGRWKEDGGRRTGGERRRTGTRDGAGGGLRSFVSGHVERGLWSEVAVTLSSMVWYRWTGKEFLIADC